MPGEIEFLGEGPRDDEPRDADASQPPAPPDPPPARRRGTGFGLASSRWTLLLELIALVVVVGVVHSRSTRTQPRATRPAPAVSGHPTSDRPAPVPSGLNPLHMHTVALRGSAARAVASPDTQLVATSGGLAAVLGAGHLVLLRPTGRVVAVREISSPAGTAGVYRLIDVPAAHRIWLVPVGGSSAGELLGYDDTTLADPVAHALPDVVVGAAALDDTLYLSTGSRAFAVDAGGAPLDNPLLLGALGPPSADQADHHLLFLTTDHGMVIWNPSQQSASEGLGHGLTIDGTAVSSIFAVRGQLWGASDEAGDTVYRALSGSDLDIVTGSVTAPTGSTLVVARRSFLLSDPGTKTAACFGRLGGVVQRWSGVSGSFALAGDWLLSTSPGGLLVASAGECG